MKKRLTDDVRREWTQELIMLQSSCDTGPVLVEKDELCALIESEQAGWEENARLKEWKETKEHIDDVTRDWWHDETAKIKHLFPFESKPGIGQIVERLLLNEALLQDAQNALLRIEGIAQDSTREEYRPNSAKLIIKVAQTAVQRIQEEES